MPSTITSGSLFCPLLIDEMARMITWVDELGEPPPVDTCRPATLPCRELAKLLVPPAVTSSALSACTAKFSFFFSWVWPIAVTTTSPRVWALSVITMLRLLWLPTFTEMGFIPTNVMSSTSLSLASIVNFPSMSVVTPRVVPCTRTDAPMTACLSVADVTTPVTVRAKPITAKMENNRSNSCFLINELFSCLYYCC